MSKLNINIPVAAIFKAERIAQGLTRRAVAIRAGIVPHLYYALETCPAPDMSLREYGRICDALKLDAGDILNDALEALRRA